MNEYFSALKRSPGETSDLQFERLPIHAKTLIERMARQLREKDMEIAELNHELSAEHGADDVIRYERALENVGRTLPPGAQVSFKIGYGWIRLMRRIDRDGNETLDVSGDSTLVVQPMASNYLLIEHRSRYSS